MDRLKGKVAIVTGAAQGIGLATAKVFAQEGAQVVMTDFNAEAGQIEAAKLDNAIFLQHDVSKEDQWKKIFKTIIEKFGKVDVVANIAGITHMDNIENITTEAWHKVLSVDLDGVMLGTKYGVLNMKDHGGSIINFSSDSGILGTPEGIAYSTAKGGVVLLSKSAALYCAQQKNNIRVNAILPGLTNTKLITDGTDGGIDYYAKFTPMGRATKPEEIAKAVLFLASDDSSYVTGSGLVVDGGYSAQ